MENFFSGNDQSDHDLDSVEQTTINGESVISKSRSDHFVEAYKDDNMEQIPHITDPSSCSHRESLQYSCYLPGLDLKQENHMEGEEMDLIDTEIGTIHGQEAVGGKNSTGKSPITAEIRDMDHKEEAPVDLWNKNFSTENSLEDKEGKNEETKNLEINPNTSQLKADDLNKAMGTSQKQNLHKSNLKPNLKSMKYIQKAGRGKFTQHSINPGLDLPLLGDERQKKKTTKKQNNYNELVNILQNMTTFNWFENYGVSQKNHPTKLFNYNSFWFLVCANYFPKINFARQNNKEFLHQRGNKIKTLLPDIPQRITKADVKMVSIEKQNPDEFESLLLTSFSKAVKYSLEDYKSNSYIQKIMSNRTINAVYQPNYTSADDEWLMEARRRIYDNYESLKAQNFLKTGNYDFFENPHLLSKIDLQDLITFYEKELYEVLVDNEKKLEELEKKALESLNKEDVINKLNIDTHDSLVDLRIRFPEEDNFIAYLEKKQNEEKENAARILNSKSLKDVPSKNGKSSSGCISVMKTKPRSNIEESVCHICNDEDYADDDLIVFCSKCNISVHQKCYGLPALPNGDWVCDLCLTFQEKGKYLRCPFCDKRGGAMKPTCTKADTFLFESLNPNFHEFLRSYAQPEYLKSLPRVKSISMSTMKHKEQDVSDKDDDEEKAEDLYYDFQLLNDGLTEEEVNDEPKPLYVWVHISCALFVPELYFGDDVNMSDVLGLENVSKERFKYECAVCGKRKNGAIVNCEKPNCKKAFHPECARRGKYFLDIRENDTNQEFVYHIYCEKHTPLKLKRTLESVENKMREDLNRFFRAVEKQHLSYITDVKQKGVEKVPIQGGLKEQDLKNTSLKKKKALSLKEEGNYFLKLIEKYIEKCRNMPCLITLLKALNENNQDCYELLEISTPKNLCKNDKKLLADDEIWSVMPYKNLTAEQKYNKYKRVLTQMKKKQAIRGTKSKASQAKGDNSSMMIQERPTRQAKMQGSQTLSNNLEVEDNKMEADYSGEIYCICKKPYHGELMIACEKCETWYHPACVGLKEEEDFETLEWYCKQCNEELEAKAKNGKLLKKRANNFQVGKEQKYIPKKKVKG